MWCEHLDPFLLYGAEKFAPGTIQKRLFGYQSPTQTRASDESVAGLLTARHSKFVDRMVKFKKQKLPSMLKSSKSLLAPDQRQWVKTRAWDKLHQFAQTTANACSGCATYCYILESCCWLPDPTSHSSAIGVADKETHKPASLIVVKHVTLPLALLGILGCGDDEGSVEWQTLALAKLGLIAFPREFTALQEQAAADFLLHEQLARASLASNAPNSKRKEKEQHTHLNVDTTCGEWNVLFLLQNVGSPQEAMRAAQQVTREYFWTATKTNFACRPFTQTDFLAAEQYLQKHVSYKSFYRNQAMFETQPSIHVIK